MKNNIKGKITFSFGKNWQNFLKSLTEPNLKHAKHSLTEFLELKHLKDKTFLDIGCGSGIFSLAAFELGAKRIVSFDVDPFSVECCKSLHKKANSPKEWEITQGSILDNQFISKLGTFDIVYSWGVLHHTGKMWNAINKSAELVNKNGYYYITIYNKVEGKLGSNLRLKIKKFYNEHPLIGKYVLETMSMLKFFAINIIKFRNPLTQIKNYKQNRGMDWKTDIADWLGGFPYEFATVEEIFRFMKSYFPNFKLINIKTNNRFALNWFLFKKIN